MSLYTAWYVGLSRATEILANGAKGLSVDLAMHSEVPYKNAMRCAVYMMESKQKVERPLGVLPG
jgi:hypothetical protein